VSSFYIREPGGSLIARVSATIPTYYHFDALGSTRLLTDSGGSVIDRYSYDAYGSLISHGSIDQPYQYVGQLGYYTHHQQPELGLLQLGVRFYDPQVGRFTSRDPAKEGLNWFVYVLNHPIKLSDPSGLACPDFTNAQCKRACNIVLGKKTKLLPVCHSICNTLKGHTCNQLWGYCSHMLRHPGDFHKNAAKICFALYDMLCLGK
jgi:RHS repeat-associated protein